MRPPMKSTSYRRGKGRATYPGVAVGVTADMDKHCKNALNRIRQAMDFPANTCSASRHVLLIGEHLAKGKLCPMLQEEPEHCAASLLATVAALYELRTALGNLIKQLDFVHGSPEFRSVWTVSHIHVGPYDGPKYEDELNAARVALKPTPTPRQREP